VLVHPAGTDSEAYLASIQPAEPEPDDETSDDEEPVESA
jgi:hypothetical protein